MYKTISGTYKAGEIRFGEPAINLPDGPVLVTFLDSRITSGETPPLTREEAAELRARLASFEADWNAPGMEVYDKP